MKLRLKDVMTRAAQRGYTPDEIRPCIGQDYGNGWYEVDVSHPSYPKTPRPGYVPSRGLGDMASDYLAAFGITPDRVSKAIGRPCGCAERAERLNQLGKKLGIGESR